MSSESILSTAIVTSALEFTIEGLLPPNDFELTIEELKESLLVAGPKNSPNWDRDWRLKLVNNLSILASQLKSVGVTSIYIDGSFTEDKDHPNDIDGYFECDIQEYATGRLQQRLNLLDPHKVWTWKPSDRRAVPGSPKKQLPMWLYYAVELYPHVPGMGCGIFDKYGNELEFPSAFRISRRNDRPRGIIKIGGLG